MSDGVHTDRDNHGPYDTYHQQGRPWAGPVDDDGLPVVPPQPRPPSGLSRAEQRQWRTEHLDEYRCHDRAQRARADAILARRAHTPDVRARGESVSQAEILDGLYVVATSADRWADRVSAWTAIARITGDVQAPAKPQPDAGESWSVTITIPTTQPSAAHPDTAQHTPGRDSATRVRVSDGKV